MAGRVPQLCPHGNLGVRRCRECGRVRGAKISRERRRRLPDEERHFGYLKKYGVTLEFVELLWTQQNKKCAICGKDLQFPHKDTHLDHEHVGGAVRGVLCNLCNSGIGYFRDSAEVLSRAAQYVRRDVHKMTVADEIAAAEGCVDYLYLDTRGNTTCGVGQLVRVASDLSRFAWSDFQAALADFALLQKMRRDCAYGVKWPATRYRPSVQARMKNPREGLTETIEHIDRDLRRRMTNFDSFPLTIQESLIDMSFNLGVDGLLKGYPKMLGAITAGDWQTAAKESHRQGVSDDRNQRTYDRIMRAYSSVAESSVRKP